MKEYKNRVFLEGSHRDMLESRIIASALMGQEFFNKVKFLVPKDFKDHLHRQAWDLIKSKNGVTKEIMKADIQLVGMYAEEIWFMHSALLGVILVEVNIYDGYQILLKEMALACKDQVEAQFILKTAQEAAFQDPLAVHRTIIKYMTSLSEPNKKKLKAFHTRVQKRIDEIKMVTDKWG